MAVTAQLAASQYKSKGGQIPLRDIPPDGFLPGFLPFAFCKYPDLPQKAGKPLVFPIAFSDWLGRTEKANKPPEAAKSANATDEKTDLIRFPFKYVIASDAHAARRDCCIRNRYTITARLALQRGRVSIRPLRYLMR